MKTTTKLLVGALLTLNLQISTFNSFAQNIGINSTGAAPDNSAILDIDATPTNDKGLLIPRLNTAERDAIASPANSLLIFNTTTNCFEWWDALGSAWVSMSCGACQIPTAPTATATLNPICEGSTLTLTGSATGATSWSWTGPNSFTSTSQSPTITNITTAGAGVYTLTASNICGAAAPVSTASVTVNTLPTAVTATASPNPICEGSTLTLTGSATGATSWSWTGPNSFTSSSQSPTITNITTAGAGIYTLTASNICGAAAPESTASVSVSQQPTTANAGSDINPACDISTATLAGNTPTVGTGLWTVVLGTATITTPSSPTSGVTGLVVPGTVTLQWTISNSPCADSYDDVIITTTTCPPTYCGTDTITTVVNVLNPTTGKTWMDRNLGASQAATSVNDAAAYGDLYQWGRCSDGHEKRTSATTGTLSSSDNPGNGNFIVAPSYPYDWRSPQNTNLWQGVGGINNPCPTGYRLPTDAELNAEKLSWSTNNAVGAFASPLKLTVAGGRSSSSGSIMNEGGYGDYWSSTVSTTKSRNLYYNFANAFNGIYDRAWGFSVRCIKD